MKKISPWLVVFMVFFFTIIPVQAQEPVKIMVDGNLLALETPPIIVNGRTLVPLRAIFQALGAEVTWNEKTQTIIGKKDNDNIILTIGSNTATINGQKIILEVPALIEKNRTLVPARFISESLGAKVAWDEKSWTVIITSPEKSKKSLSPKEIGKKANTVVYIQTTKVGGSVVQGSGFFISPDGQIATNYHVIDKALKIEIILDNGTKFNSLEVLGYDKFKDLAILKIPVKDVPYNQLINPQEPELGSEVVAIGNPAGLQNTLSTGVISGIRTDLLQISAPIGPGSSGGALFNIYGEVIGITSAGLGEGGNLGFAIPIKELASLNLNKSLTLEALYQLEYPGRKMNLNYDQFADYLWETSSIFHIKNKTYTVEFNDISITQETEYPETLALYFYLDRKNFSILENAYHDGYEGDITSLFAEVMADLKEYYYDKNVIAMIIYADDGFDTLPAAYAKNSLTDEATVELNEATGKWEVWYPVLALGSRSSDDYYTYMWALK